MNQLAKNIFFYFLKFRKNGRYKIERKAKHEAWDSNNAGK